MGTWFALRSEWLFDDWQTEMEANVAVQAKEDCGRYFSGDQEVLQINQKNIYFACLKKLLSFHN